MASVRQRIDTDWSSYPLRTYTMGMEKTTTGRTERLLLPVGAGILVLALVLSVWTITVRERTTRRLHLEYQAHRALTGLTDLARAQALGQEDTRDVIAFGLYSIDGEWLTGFGDAPKAIAPLPVEPSTFTVESDHVVMIRALGGDLPGRRVLLGNERTRTRDQGQSGQAGQQMYPMMPPGYAPNFRETLARMPAVAYIRLSTAGVMRQELASMVWAAVVSVTLAVLYGALVYLYRRYLSARDREVRDRELVELGQAARTIAHEIKNPLGVIRIQCGILKKGADERTAASVAVIDSEAMRLANLADRIRSFLKTGDSVATPVALSGYATQFVARYSGRIDSTVHLDTDDTAVFDQARITEALDNMVANALEASAGSAERPHLIVQTRQRKVLFVVQDRGPGVEDPGRMFEPFYTTKEKGSGLGLALARKNIEAAGGSITYTPRNGGGSEFTVTLPLASG